MPAGAMVSGGPRAGRENDRGERSVLATVVELSLFIALVLTLY